MIKKLLKIVLNHKKTYGDFTKQYVGNNRYCAATNILYNNVMPQNNAI